RFDAAVRLELNEWNGAVEPRLVLRALCRTEPGACTPLSGERPLLESFERALGAPVDTSAHAGPRIRVVHDRRGDGFAGLAGELVSSGEGVAIVCADAGR